MGQGTRDFSDVDMTAVDGELARRLSWAKKRVDLDAGRYETLLPPSAVADLLAYMYWTAVARDADDGRTVFSRQGGGTRVGERLAEKPLRVWSDPAADGLQCDPVVFAAESGSSHSVFDNGLPLERDGLDRRRRAQGADPDPALRRADRPAADARGRQPADGLR